MSITFESFKENIGKLVSKKSEKPFKSRLLINTVKDVIIHPILKIPAYTFTEDDSYVECRRCTTNVHVANHPAYKIAIEEGYSNLKLVNGSLCGLFRFVYTTGLVIGITQYGYIGRFCYSGKADAEEALRNWDGKADPEGPWIKYKGEGGERSNPKNN